MNAILNYPLSALFYLLIIFSTTALAFIASKLKTKVIRNFILLNTVLLLSLVSGLRGSNVGTDTIRYIMHIRAWQEGIYNMYPTEPGLRIISVLSSKFLEGPVLTLIVVSLIINSLIVYRLWSYRNQISFGFSIFLYSSIYYVMTLSGFRQWLAVSIIFFATKYLIEMKYVKFSLFVVFASIFHNTALIAFAILFLDLILNKASNKKQKKTYNIIIFLLPVIVFLLVFLENKLSFMSQYINIYSSIDWNGSTGLLIWIKLFICFLIYFVFKKSDFNNYDFYIRIYRIYLFGLLISIPGYYIASLSRIGLYFVIVELILYGIIVKSENRNKSQLFALLLCAFTILMFFVELAGSGRGHMPYVPFWLDENY